MLPTCPSATTSKQTTSTDDRRFLPRSSICSPNWGWAQSEGHFNKKNLHTSRIRVKNVYLVSDQNVILRYKISSLLPSTKKIAQFFWGATKPTVIMTASKSVTRLFQTKAISQPLRNFGLHSTLCCNSFL